VDDDGAGPVIPAQVPVRFRRHPSAARRPYFLEEQLSDTITLTGIVGSEPRAITTAEGLAITSFRLASTQRRFDKGQEKWVDGETNWYTISTFRQLATNSAVSVKKGERVLVTGRLRIREWESGGKTGTNIEIEADAVGHDLSWGTASFSRGSGSTPIDTGAAAEAGSFPSESDLAATSGADSAGADLGGRDLAGADQAGADLAVPF
jgi:single-strand DNA-binding protein